MSELKPCPFCGNEAKVYDTKPMPGAGLVRCSNPNPRDCILARYGPFNLEQWNTRKEDKR